MLKPALLIAVNLLSLAAGSPTNITLKNDFACGGRLTTTSYITVTSYPANVNCIWTIEPLQSAARVMATFEYVNLNIASTCGENDDHIKIYEGTQVDPENQLAVVCGNSKSHLVVPATGRTMTFQFRSVREGKGFSAKVYLTDPEMYGCGGRMDMYVNRPITLKPPQLNFIQSRATLNCIWDVVAPAGHIVDIKFLDFSYPLCDADATNPKCDCNFVDIRDGLAPDSMIIGSYCGRRLDSLQVQSSTNKISVWMSSEPSTGFSYWFQVQQPKCNYTIIDVMRESTQVLSPGCLDDGVNCAYQFNSDSVVHLTIKSLDLKTGTTNALCDQDKLVIKKLSTAEEIGKDFVVRNDQLLCTDENSILKKYDFHSTVTLTRQYEICGAHQNIELYVRGSFLLNLMTLAEHVSPVYRGFDIEVTVPHFCKTYTNAYGRIVSVNDEDNCDAVIVAPENHYISVYFIAYALNNADANSNYIDVHDGENTSDNQIASTRGRVFDFGEVPEPIFSTGRYLSLKNVKSTGSKAVVDMNYVVTDKGRGCGGHLMGDQGVITSPLYPQTYAREDSCEWEIETPPGVGLALRFYELRASNCNRNYIQLLNRDGQVVETFCSAPVEYTSADSYVKIVSRTFDDAGSSWIALFSSVAV